MYHGLFLHKVMFRSMFGRTNEKGSLLLEQDLCVYFEVWIKAIDSYC